MSNKKSLMAFSAILILFFHLWINVFDGNAIESFFRQIAYVGVDIFFFVSAYSLSNRKIIDYKSFYISRFKTVYVKFLLFSIVAFFYFGWKFDYLLRVISGINLFEKGGGAFLWFLPAIMLFYICFPVLEMMYEKCRIVPIIVLVVWFALGITISTYTSYKAMFIFFNRIPIFVLGFYSAKLNLLKKLSENKRCKAIVGMLLFVIGNAMMYALSYQERLQKPMVDFFYIVGVPLCIGLILLIDFIKENKVIAAIGSATLEMYAVQMIFGYAFANKLFVMLGNRLLTNVITMLFVVLLAVVIREIYTRLGAFLGDVFRQKILR